ncbi:PH domain-containing protein [Madurella fahalii]|uniref:PH domain-containing protein n=1 Tax=Madurella fahalii TaxID=1157608 RepID=A0ABQ0G9J4_9PEZI
MNVLIDKNTSVQDVLEACSNEMKKRSQEMSPDTSVLIEPFSNPGLERRLRRYERIADVMNSWDQDSQHMLIVLPASPETDGELELRRVPISSEAPDGFSFPFYHTRRTRRWSKCYVTLYQQSGQMVESQKPHPKSGDRDVAKLCHLSDYDIYTPTEAEKRKILKPPKKYCYAIKTQQRSALFFNNSNYVHYFSTDNAEVARQFRARVHSWRSWYLVNKKLNLQNAKGARPPTRSRDIYGDDHTGAPIDREPAPHSIPTRITKAPPPLPAVPDAYRKKNESAFAVNGLLGNGYDQRKAQATRMDITLRNQPDNTVVMGPSNEPFTDGPSLLNGRAAAAHSTSGNGRPRTSGSDKPVTARPPSSGSSNRSLSGGSPPQKQQQQYQRPAYPAPPPARRPSTSSRAPPTRAPSIRAPSTRSRSCERSPPPPPPPVPPALAQQQPLIDLTPTFVEAPQWSREGRGRGVRVPDGKPLVDMATGPALPSGGAARLRDRSGPPQKLIRREDVPAGLTLLEQQQRKRGATLTEGPGSGSRPPISSGGLLARAMTMRSTAASTRTAGGAGAADGFYAQPPPQPQSQSQSQSQFRGRTRTMTATGEAERERLRERLRSVERGR